MKRMHVNLKTHDLDASVRFYAALFGAAPTKRKPDYAKWMLDDPRVNFSLSRAGGSESSNALGIEHLGIEAETEDELADLRDAAQRAKGAMHEARVVEEGEAVCCYAASDKTWIADPQCVQWELFHTHGESATYFAEGGDPSACCAGEGAFGKGAPGEGATHCC